MRALSFRVCAAALYRRHRRTLAPGSLSKSFTMPASVPADGGQSALMGGIFAPKGGFPASVGVFSTLSGDSPVFENNPGSHLQMSCRDKKTSCKDKKTSCKDEKISCRDKKTSCKDKKTSCRDKKTSCKDKKTSCRVLRISLNGKKNSLWKAWQPCRGAVD